MWEIYVLQCSEGFPDACRATSVEGSQRREDGSGREGVYHSFEAGGGIVLAYEPGYLYRILFV